MRIVPFIAAALLLAAPAGAGVANTSASGFLTQTTLDVKAPPAAVWRMLVRPSQWWDANHSYSKKPDNLTLDARAGGCFCEKLPASGGGVEHMRVIHLVPNEMLRLSGALGPLQRDGVVGTLTVTLKAVPGGTRISWDYAVGGYLRAPAARLAPVVDQVMTAQLGRLGDKLGRLRRAPG